MDAHSLECLDFPRVRELLAGYAATSLGKGLALTVRPSTRADLIRRWLAQVSELRQLCELRGLPPFAGVRDVREAIRRCTPPLQVQVEEMAAIGDTLAATHEICRYLADLPAESMPELRHLAERIGDFQTIAERIQRVIDDRCNVRDDASPKIARIRRDVAEAHGQIEHVVERLLQDASVRRLLQFPNHTYFNDRLVLPLKMEYRGRLPGIIHRASDSGATLYVEPSAAVELNNRISNLRAEENEEIARLLWELAHEVHINEEAILKTIDTLAVLDLSVAKVRMAREFFSICPPVTDAPSLVARNARHPLLLDLVKKKRAGGELAQDVVPISFRLGGADFDMLIITGPNTGGKTVTLKTIGLLVLMVQAGMPVPVDEGSSFGVFREVFIDIGDEQNMQQSLSTFSAHMTRQMEMLKRVGDHSLVLLDELGAGTDPDEGAAIGRAILDELLRLGTRCVATTHLGALKSFPLQRSRAENACVDFDIETLRPTYHLRIGEPGMSNAIAIASRLGMPKRLVAMAHGNLSRGHRVFHTALKDTVAAKRQAEQARDAAESARIDADKKVTEAEAAKAMFERQQADFQQWVQRVIHLQPGDAVRVRGFDRDGKIVRVRLDLHRAEVDVGSFAVEVPLGDVLPPETPAPPPKPAPPPRPKEPPKPRGEGQPLRVEGQPQRGEREAHRPALRGGERPQHAGNGGQGQRPQGGPREGKRPPPEYPSLTDEQASKLEAGEHVYVKRFHRDGVIIRVAPDKKVAAVSVGLLEVEVPFSGLAQSTRRK